MFEDFQTFLTHPVTAPLVLIAILVLLVFLTLHIVQPERKASEPRFSDNPALNVLAWLALTLSPLGALIFVAALWELGMLAWHYPTSDSPASDLGWHSSLMLAMLAAIGALFTLLFAYVRMFTTERQTRAAEEGLITDRISKAIDQLGHENTAVRMGAIHSLERIMVDSMGDRVMVMRTLNAYLQYRQSRLPPEDPANIPEVEIDVQAALDVMVRWHVE